MEIDPELVPVIKHWGADKKVVAVKEPGVIMVEGKLSVTLPTLFETLIWLEAPERLETATVAIEVQVMGELVPPPEVSISPTAPALVGKLKLYVPAILWGKIEMVPEVDPFKRKSGVASEVVAVSVPGAINVVGKLRVMAP